MPYHIDSRAWLRSEGCSLRTIQLLGKDRTLSIKRHHRETSRQTHRFGSSLSYLPNLYFDVQRRRMSCLLEEAPLIADQDRINGGFLQHTLARCRKTIRLPTPPPSIAATDRDTGWLSPHPTCLTPLVTQQPSRKRFAAAATRSFPSAT